MPVPGKVSTKRILLGSVKVAAEVADLVRSPGRGVVVLIYHRVGGRSGGEIDLPAQLFEEQMATLAEQGLVVTLDDALMAVRGPAPPGRDPVVVTFDDGTADFADVVLPILERHRVPVTLYVASDFLERQRTFPNDGQPLSWSALRDTLSTGLVTVGSHTHTHVLLDRVSPEVVERELDTSARLVEERLGLVAQHFAYPKAVLGSDSAEAAVRSRFRSAAVGGGRPNPYGETDPYRISRSAVQVTDGMRWFLRKSDGGMAMEEALRRRLNRRRYERATN